LVCGTAYINEPWYKGVLMSIPWRAVNGMAVKRPKYMSPSICMEVPGGGAHHRQAYGARVL